MAAKKKKASDGRGGPGRGQGRKRSLKQAITTTSSFVCTTDEKAELKRRAQRARLSQSSYVRRALGWTPVAVGEASSDGGALNKRDEDA